MKFDKITDENSEFSNFTVEDTATMWYNKVSADEIKGFLTKKFSAYKECLIKTISPVERLHIFESLDKEFGKKLLNKEPIEDVKHAKTDVDQGSESNRRNNRKTQKGKETKLD